MPFKFNPITGKFNLIDSDAKSIQGTPVDASVGSPSDGDILVYRTAGADFVLESKPAGGSNPAINDVTDVTITSVADNEVLAYDSASGNWINQTAAEAGLQPVLAEGAFVDGDKTKLSGIETGADVTDTANVTAAGALMDSEVDANLKTLSLPANTTISAFGATVIDDADAATARATLDVDQAGTDNSTDVTLSGTGTYLSLTGQVITVDPITESDISDLGAYITDITGSPLSELSDVSITSIASGEILKWNGTAWVNNTITEAGLATSAQGSLADSAVQPSDNISTLTNDSGFITATLTQEQVEDYAGNLISNPTGTHTGITVTYQDATGDVDFVVASQTENDFTTVLKNKLDGIEAGADVTDTTNVTAAGALMDSEVDADIKTLSLPANTTISAFGASLVDDVDAATARATLDVDQAGTDNSTNVTLAGTGTYLSLTGQQITVDPITESDISDLGSYITASSTDTLTNKTLDGEGTGNSFKNGATLTKSITIESPTSSEDISMFYTPVAITVTEMVAVLVGSSTPSVTWTVRHSTDRSAVGNEVVTSGTTTTSTTTGSVVTSFNDATIPADSFVWVETSASSGTVNSIQISLEYTED